MGGSFSGENSGGLGDLPESCVACILSRLDPSEICRVARVNSTFHRASLSDSLWESKLPENHQILIHKLFRSDACSFTKKDIFARLTTPVRFASHTKEVWLEEGRGGISVAISWKGLKITGIDDPRYWTHISTIDSRFGTVAFLQQAWWVEVEGSLEFEFPIGDYSLFFRLCLVRPSVTGRRNSDNVHGWDVEPVTFQLESSSSGHVKCEGFLHGKGKWQYHHVGDFVVENSNIPTSLKFSLSLSRIDSTHTRGGLCVDSVFVFPRKR